MELRALEYMRVWECCVCGSLVRCMRYIDACFRINLVDATVLIVQQFLACFRHSPEA